MNNEEILRFAESTNKKLGLISTILARQASRSGSIIKDKVEEQKPSVINSGDNAMKALSSSMNIIASSLKRINTTLSKLSTVSQIGAIPSMAPTPAGTSKPVDKERKEKQEGVGSLFQSLLNNPAVVAALGGLAYFYLPKEVQKELLDFFTIFYKRIEKMVDEFTGFNGTLKTAGIAIGTVFGIKMLAGLAEAILITVKMIKLLGVGGRALGKLGMAGGVIAGSAAYMGYKAFTDDDEKETDKETPTPSYTPPSTQNEAKPAAAGLRPGGSVGIKPGGEFGIKAPPPPEIKDVIAKASKMVGVDESTMIAVARQESGFNPTARASTSSAKGLYQFVDATWNDMVRKYGKQYPELNKGPMDPLASAIAGALYIKENTRVLEKAGIPVNPTNLYALHFLGAGGGPRLLRSDPSVIAAEILPEAAQANKSVFYNRDGSPRTVRDVINFLYGKVGSYAEAYASGNMPERDVSKPAAQPVKTVTTGSDVNAASMGVRILTTAPSTNNTQVAKVNNTNAMDIGSDKTRNSAPIPSPIANRGSLNGYVKHSTSYV